MGRAIARGLTDLFSRGRLAFIFWSWSLFVAAAGSIPAARWIGNVWPTRPEADAMLHGFDAAVFRDLWTGSGQGALMLAGTSVAVAAVLAFVGGAFISAGIIHVLLDRDEHERTRTLWSRVGRGAGQAFRRSLAVSGLAVATFVLVAIPASAALGVVFERIGDRPSEVAAWIGMLGPLIPLALIGAAVAASADYARIRVVADPLCGAVRAWVSALWFTLRHPMSTGMIWATFAAMTGVVLLLSFTWSQVLPSHTYTWIAALVLAQQAAMFARAMIRVGALSAETTYAAAKHFGIPDLPPAEPPAVAAGDDAWVGIARADRPQVERAVETDPPTPGDRTGARDDTDTR